MHLTKNIDFKGSLFEEYWSIWDVVLYKNLKYILWVDQVTNFEVLRRIEKD